MQTSQQGAAQEKQAIVTLVRDSKNGRRGAKNSGLGHN